MKKVSLGIGVLMVVTVLTAIPQTSNQQGASSIWTSDLWLLKTDSLGDTIWTRTYDYPSGGGQVYQTRDGGYVIAWENGVLKTDSLGDTLWSWHHLAILGAGEYLAYTSDGSYVLTGSKRCEGKLDDLRLLKLDSLGNALWERTYDWGGREEGVSVIETKDGGYLVIGYAITYSPPGEGLLLLKTDAQGDTLWSLIYEGEKYAGGKHVQQTSDGDYIAVGWDDDNMLLIKTDPNGETLWRRIYGVSNHNEAGYVRKALDGEYVISGSISDRDVLLKVNARGDSTWSCNLRLPGHFFVKTDDGGYIFTGVSPDPKDIWNEDLCLLKTDSLGRVLWKHSWGGPYLDLGWCVRQTSDGGYIIVGQRDGRKWYPGLDSLPKSGN